MFIEGSIPTADGKTCTTGFVVQQHDDGSLRVDNELVPEFWLEIHGDRVTGRLASGVLKNPRGFHVRREGDDIRVDHAENLAFWLTITPAETA